MKNLIILLALAGVCFAQTKNIVPRAAHEGQIGTAAKPWKKGIFDSLFISYSSRDTAWHGAINTAIAGKCASNDSRLSDSRPASDVYPWAKAEAKPEYTYMEVGADASGAAATVQSNLSTHEGITTTAHGGICATNDSRLSDARTPTAHDQAISTITGLQTALDGKLATGGTAADVNVSGTNIAAALSGKLSTSGTAADVNVSGTNISSALTGKEPALGNPSVTGYVLSSTTGGTRSWVANGGGSMVYPGAGVAVSTGSAWGTSLTAPTYIMNNPLTTIGDLLYASSTATPATPSRLAAVATGSVLTSAGTGTAPVYSATPTVTRINNQGLKNNFSTASQAPTAATRTYITGSKIQMTAGSFQIGTIFEWTFQVTKTAAGTAAGTVDICFGTAGTTSDAARVSFAKAAGTGVVDCGLFTITAIVRGPLSASCVVAGHMTFTHNLSTTGLANLPCINVTTISSAFNITTPTNVGVCITTGASDAYTIQLVVAKAWNL